MTCRYSNKTHIQERFADATATTASARAGADKSAGDVDGDGELTRDEIARGLEERTGAAPSPILLDNVMAALDSDHSGTISRAEFANR